MSAAALALPSPIRGTRRSYGIRTAPYAEFIRRAPILCPSDLASTGYQQTEQGRHDDMSKTFKALAQKKTLFALLLALTIFGAVYGFAATLNVGANALSAGNAAVASCQASGTPTGTYALTYDSTIPGYKVSGVTVTGMDPLCNGKTVSVTLTGTGNASLASGNAVYSSAGASTTVAIGALSATPNATTVTGVSVAVNG